MIWSAAADGACNFFNARMSAFAGRPPGALSELFHPHDRERRERRLKKGGAFVLESRLRRADGQWRWVREEVTPCFLGFVGTALDITEYREDAAALERELERQAVQARALWLRLADLQEAERRRLSTELHDRAGDPLTALRLELAAVLQGDLTGEARAKLERCVGHVRSTVDAITEVMSELRPPMLDEHGLAAALHWYAGQLPFDVAVSAPQEPPRLVPQVESAFFRIAQECLRNVARHAKAGHVEITLSHEGGRSATLRVEDDGVGFERTAAERTWRWGLLTMRERAHAVGARLDIASRRGEGTCITVVLQP
jgi:two-component system, NarL family, sensor histidine kinase UhpB